MVLELDFLFTRKEKFILFLEAFDALEFIDKKNDFIVRLEIMLDLYR